jgi:hypothetical protein
LAGRLAFFDLRDPMSARAYYGAALDSSREADDPHLAAATLGHLSFVPAASGGFNAAADLLEGANKSAAKITVLPSWLASVEADPGQSREEPRITDGDRPRRRLANPRP